MAGFRGLVFVLFLASFLTGGLRAGEKKEKVHSIKKEFWNVGFCSLEGEDGLDSPSRYLLHALPVMLRNELSDISIHQFSREEREACRQDYLEEGLLKLQKEKSGLVKKRDALLFSEDSQSKGRKEYDKITKQIKAKQKEAEEWQGLISADILFPGEAEVRFPQPKKGDNVLWPSRLHYDNSFMKKQKLDLLVYGHLEKQKKDFVLTLNARASHGEKPLFSLNERVGETDLEELVLKAAGELRTVILGRSWTELAVKTRLQEGRISIDGMPMGVGYVRARNLRPGFVTLTVKKEGYQESRQQLYLSAFSFREVLVDLPVGDSQTLFVASVPPGADVYEGALWMGQTPLNIPRPDDGSWIRVSKEEFMPFIVSSSKIKGNALTVKLSSDIFDRGLHLKKTKRKFYRSLGWFTVSLAFPVILSGIYQNFRDSYNANVALYDNTGSRKAYDDALQARKLGNACFYGYWGSVALSSGLFINLMFRLGSYIKAANESTQG